MISRGRSFNETRGRSQRGGASQRDKKPEKKVVFDAAYYERKHGMYYKDLMFWIVNKGGGVNDVESYINGDLRLTSLLYLLQTSIPVENKPYVNLSHLDHLRSRYFKPKILDFGTESVEYLTALEKTFDASLVEGLNVHETGCNYGRERSKRIRLYDGITVPDDMEGYNIINVRMVLHHADNWRSLLDQLFTRLRPGGSLVILEHDVVHTAQDKYPDQKLCLDIIHDIYDYVIHRKQDKIEGPLSNIGLIQRDDLIAHAQSLTSNVVYDIPVPYNKNLSSKIIVTLVR